MKENGIACHTPYTINIIQVNVVEAFRDKLGSSNNHWIKFPIIPRESIIQNNIIEPIRGVTIIGKREKKITIPLNFLLIEFTPKAINKPSKSIMGVTVNVKVSVKKTAL